MELTSTRTSWCGSWWCVWGEEAPKDRARAHTVHAPHTRAQVKRIVERAYRRAKDLLTTNMEVMHKIAAVLIEKENIDGDEFQKIILESQVEQYLKDDAPGVTIPYQ